MVEELPPEGYEVEFSDDDGRTYASTGIRQDKPIVLRYQPAKAA